MNSSSQPPPASSVIAFGPVVDRGRSIVALVWVEAVVASLFITLRFVSRKIGKSIGLDDWMMLVATVALIVSTCLVTWMSSLGGFRHVWHIYPPNISTVALASHIFRTVSIIGVFTSKFSVGYLLLRILPPGPSPMRMFIWFIILFTVLHNFQGMVLNWFTCKPSRKLWNPQIPGTCWPNSAKLGWIYMGLTLNIIADFVLGILPARIIYNLQLSLAKRIRVYILLSLSLTATVCAVFKFVHMKTVLHTEDFGWATWELTIWTQSEIFVIIVCGSVASLKPLFDRYSPGLLAGKSTAHRSSGYTRSESRVYYKGSASKSRAHCGENLELNDRERIWERLDVDVSTSTQTSVNVLRD